MVDISLQKTTDSPTIFLFSATWISGPAAHGPTGFHGPAGFQGWKPPGVYSMDLSGWKPMNDEWMADANGWYMAIYTKRGLNHIYKSPFQLLQIYYKLDDLVIIHQVPNNLTCRVHVNPFTSKTHHKMCYKILHQGWDGKKNCCINFISKGESLFCSSTFATKVNIQWPCAPVA